MNWKAEAMERLRKYDAMRQCVQNIPEELKRLELESCGIRSTGVNGDPLRGSQNSADEALLSNLVHQQQLRFALEQAELWLKTTERGLSALTPEEKLVLHRFYMYPERGSVDRLCGELGVEQSSVYRKRDKALYRFTIALYGCPEQ